MKALALALLIMGCTVDRRSDAFTCVTSADCSGGRQCAGGYCVTDSPCPSQCDSCDTSQDPPVCTVADPSGDFTCPNGTHCNITCNRPGACTAVTCANNAHCTIECSAAGACDDITCSGKSCDVSCTAPGACGTIVCGNNHGSCNLECTGIGACGSVTCSSACSCDLSCSNGDCGAVTCPEHNGNACETDGACSSQPDGCNSC